MTGTKGRVWLFQLYIVILKLMIQIKFLNGVDNNATDIQMLLDDFITSENGSNLLNSNLNQIFESSADNDTTDELVIKKNLYIFPVNAPNLVISQKHEIHAIPVQNATNSTDSEPVTELQDVNEISLSKLLPTNGSDSENGSYFQTNLNLTEPKNLEIVSAYKPGLGLITQEIPLPQTISKSITLPQNSIADLISSLNDTAKESNMQANDSSEIIKRGAGDESEVKMVHTLREKFINF